MMRKLLPGCCQALRLGQQAEASGLLVPILESVAQLLNPMPATTANLLKESLARTLHYQETQNLIALADELEFVLLPLIEAPMASKG